MAVKVLSVLHTSRNAVALLNVALEHLTRLRLRHAEAALSGGASVTEAALTAGFESLSYFSRTYKRLYGHPPSKKSKA